MSPDGQRIAFTAELSGIVSDVYLRPLRGPGPDTLLVQTAQNKVVHDWSPDGQWLTFSATDANTGTDLWIVRADGSAAPRPYLQSAANEIQGRISPDGRWLAYASDESGNWEVYVDSFPTPGNKVAVSTAGGMQPVWRSDGSELFYITVDLTLTAVQTRLGPRIQLGGSRPLFRAPVADGRNVYRAHYAVSDDGQRFLMDAADPSTQGALTLLMNWRSAS
jgi:Tol biopolymer transport system component